MASNVMSSYRNMTQTTPQEAEALRGIRDVAIEYYQTVLRSLAWLPDRVRAKLDLDIRAFAYGDALSTLCAGCGSNYVYAKLCSACKTHRFCCLECRDAAWKRREVRQQCRALEQQEQQRQQEQQEQQGQQEQQEQQEQQV